MPSPGAFSTFEQDLLVFALSTHNSNSTTCNFISNGDFESVINEFCQKLFSVTCDGNATFSDIREFFNSLLNNLVSSETCYSSTDMLCIGVACLSAFVQCNWTGSFNDTLYDTVINNIKTHYSLGAEDNKDEANNHIHKSLTSNGANDVCSVIVRPELLLLSQCIFQCQNFKLESSRWWLIRSYYIHQMLMEYPSEELYNKLTCLIDDVECSVNQLDLKFFTTLFSLETAQIYLQLYSRVSSAKKYIDQAMHILDLETNFVGALGKRTQFQQRDIAQLTLKVVSKNCTNDDVCNYRDYLNHSVSKFPKDSELDNTVRLSQIKFVNEEDGQYIELNILQQLAVLGSFMFDLKSKPKDEIKCEELLPYLNCVLSQPKLWSLQFSALAFRSNLECNNSKTIERSLTQLQELIDSLKANDPSVLERFHFFYCCYVPPKWKVQEEFGRILFELGAVQSALDEFIQLQAWEQIVTCYTVLKLKHKAEEVIRSEIEKKGATVKMLYSLGDVTDDESFYEKAWLLSSCRSGAAQRHWALFNFNKKQYKESIPHLQKSLEINSLQETLWLKLGYAALVQEEWELSATAYRRYCYLEPESFEAWNNLAKAYVKLNQKERAMKALQEAVKYNYDNWRIWDNLAVVSTDCGNFHETIRCYHRLLDLKEKHVDLEILTILVKFVGTISPNIDDAILKKEMLKLFGRITSQVPNNADLWILYADLTESMCDQITENESKMVQYLQRAHGIYSQTQKWKHSFDDCKDFIALGLQLATAYESYSCQLNGEPARSQLNSAKLMLRSVISLLTREFCSVIPEDINSKIVIDKLDELRNKLTYIEGKISTLN